MALRLGKIPTASVRRRISLLSRSIVIWSWVPRQGCDLRVCVLDGVLDVAVPVVDDGLSMDRSLPKRDVSTVPSR